MLPPLRLRHLEVMLAVAATGSMQRAASQVFLTQPAISKLIAEIEAAFGAPLFERSRRGVTLTECGRAFAERAQCLLNDLGHLQEDIAAIGRGAIGHLRIGALAVVESSVLPRSLLALRQRAPLLRIRIEEGTRAALLDSLRRAELDCVFGRLDMSASDPAFRSESLLRVPVRIVVRPAHPLAQRKRIAPADLLAHPWLLPRAGAPIRRAIDSLFAEAGLAAPEPLVESTSIRLNYELIRSSDMIGSMTADAAESYAAQRQLAILPIELGERLPPVGVIMRPSGMTRALALFLDVLRAGCG